MRIERRTSNVELPTSNGQKHAFDLEERLLEYAARICRLTAKMPRSRAGNHVARQLLRSGTSPLPNHGEGRVRLGEVMPARFVGYCMFLWVVFAGLRASATVEPGSEDQLRFLTAHCLQVQSKIKSLTFKCAIDYQHYERAPQEFPTPDTHEDWEVWQRGQWRSAARSAQNALQNSFTRAVLNDSFFACAVRVEKPTSTAPRVPSRASWTASQFLHESLKSISDREQIHIRMHNQLDLLKFGLGDSHFFFSDFDLTLPSVRWRVQVQGSLYKVIGVYTETGLEDRWLFDSSKNFFVVEVTHYHRGKLLDQLTIEPEQVGDFWLARSAEQTRYRDGKTVRERTRWAFRDQHVDVTIPDKIFTIAFLELPDATPVTQTQPNGDKQTMIYSQGAVLPPKAAHAAARLRKERQNSDLASQRKQIAPPTPIASSGIKNAAVLKGVIGLLVICIGVFILMYGRELKRR